MNIEILKPELERRVREGIQSGRFNDVDELLTKALDALSEKEAAERTLPALGLGLFGSPDDAALLDEVVSMAYKDRRRPSKHQRVL